MACYAQPFLGSEVRYLHTGDIYTPCIKITFKSPGLAMSWFLHLSTSKAGTHFPFWPLGDVLCICSTPTPTPNTRDCLLLMQIPFWPLVTVLYTCNIPLITKRYLIYVQCPLQPLSDVSCTCTSLSGHKGLSCAHAVPLLSTRCCLVLTSTLSKPAVWFRKLYPWGPHHHHREWTDRILA